MAASISTAAYLTVIGHSAKYSTHDINGVFLSDKDGTVVAAVPIAHRHLALAPTLQMALLQIEVYAEQAGLDIVGYYQAAAHGATSSLDEIGQTIFDKLCANLKGEASKRAFAVTIKNDALSPEGRDASALKLIANNGSVKSIELKDTAKTLAAARRMLEGTDYETLADFDDHLTDPAQDFINKKLLARLAAE